MLTCRTFWGTQTNPKRAEPTTGAAFRGSASPVGAAGRARAARSGGDSARHADVVAAIGPFWALQRPSARTPQRPARGRAYLFSGGTGGTGRSSTATPACSGASSGAGFSSAPISAVPKLKDLRDTFASQLLSAGIQLGYVSTQLGHSDVGITARHYGAAARAAPPPFKVGVRGCALADLDLRLEAFVAAGNFSPDLGARYLEFENLRQDTAYDFLLRPPTTASSGRFLCHEVPLSANIAQLMPPWRPFFAPFSASD